MSRSIPFPIFLLCLLYFILPSSGIALGQDANDDELSHTDYLPRYRKSNLNFLITKVEYRQKNMTLFFRYIATGNEQVKLFGKNTSGAWAIATVSRPGAQTVSKKAAIFNIRINDRLKIAELPSRDQVTYSLEKGDIISCEIVVEKMPHFIKVVNLIGGERLRNKDRFACTDLLLKSGENRTLGSNKQMETLITNFYREFDYIRYPDIKRLTSLDEEEKFVQKTKNTNQPVTPIKNSMKPIDYMPNMLKSIEDLQCQERVILRNVYFGDNSAEFTKRVQAIRTLNIVVSYLRRYPDAKIVLHGHTDIFGDPYRNLLLSKQRVLTVKRVFVQKGIAKNRVITLYHGGSQPLPRYKDGGGMNRRVEVEVICKDKVTSSR